jgi:hypothetical protein
MSVDVDLVLRPGHGGADGDALLSLGGKPVDQECEVEAAALGADCLRIALQRVQMVGEHELRVV